MVRRPRDPMATTRSTPSKAKATKSKAPSGAAKKASRKAKTEDAELESEAEAEEGEEGAAEKVSARAKNNTLVIVESPAKAKTIKKYLGSGYTVKASVGHVLDLPKSKIGIDIEDGFKPTYEIIQGKQKVMTEIKAAAKNA